MSLQIELPKWIIERRSRMERVELPCTCCSAEWVLVDTMRDRNGLHRLVFECEACNTAWANTEPGVVELLAARMADSAHDSAHGSAKGAL